MPGQKRGRKPKGTKKELTVKWIVANKKIIKFIEEEDTTYKLADNVLEYLDEIKPNVPVNVTIDKGSVIFIQKIEGVVVSNEEPEQTSSNNDVYTVKAISKTRDYYLFEEAGEKEWFTVAKNVKGFLKDVKKGDQLEINVEVTTNDKNKEVKTIVFAKIKSQNKEVKEDQPKEKTQTKKSSYRDEDAMDKRTALMVAKDIVTVLLENDKIDNKQVKEVLKDLTKASYDNIQEL